MNAEFQQWREKIGAEEYFDFLEDLEEEQALERREEPAFERQWMTEYERLCTQKERLPENEWEAVNKVRELAFKSSFRVLPSPDVAAYLSDDFELIAISLLLGDKTSWPLQALLKAYDQGRFPPL